MTTVKDRTTYFFSEMLDGGDGEILKNLYLNEADELRIVQLVYAQGADDPVVDGVFRVGWEGVSDCIGFFDLGSHSSNLNIRINVHGKQIAGKQKFIIYDVQGNKFLTLSGELAVVFETVKY